MITGSILLLILALFILYNIISSIRTIVKWYFGDYINTQLLMARIDPLYKEPLRKYNTYYQQLNPSDKVIFEKRVQKFINKKQFIARGMNRVTDEMKALIAGAAIQLTFGHPSIYLEHFKRILVYPDGYYSQISKRYHKGEVNMGGLIVLSWKNFVKGQADYNDGRNLGLHEMAHALRLENVITNEEYRFLDKEAVNSWNKLALEEMKKPEEGSSGFFRSYASTNSQEFFAVAVENFFEKSHEFHEKHPELYRTLSIMLNQDPMKIGKLV